MKYNDLSFGTVEAIVNKLGGMEGVQEFLSGRKVVVPVVKTYRISVTYTYQYWSNVHNEQVVYKTHENPKKIDDDILKSRLWVYRGMHYGNMCDRLHIKEVQEISESEILGSDTVLEFSNSSLVPVTLLK